MFKPQFLQFPGRKVLLMESTNIQSASKWNENMP